VDAGKASSGPSALRKPGAASQSDGMEATPRLSELSRAECLRLLESAAVGRIGVSIDALPAIFPVFITVVDGVVAFRTVPGTKLAAASAGAIVALEADTFDDRTGEGWSVLVRGVATETTDDTRIATARGRLKETWIDGAPMHLVEISPDLVTGRRLR
jgi:nitroimidazol reductase NimA-like FMN-containing flavoprotein (pyridoxamine 5'-phosphate oxidase superfamily)